MATVSSRTQVRRQQVVEEALDHAVAIMTEHGAGGLSIMEIARRLGIRGPSLYKYFPSLAAVYDSLFARGLRLSGEAIAAATARTDPGTATLRAGGEAVIRWAVANPALAQLLFWRPIPDFEPSPETFAASTDDMALLRAQLREAVRRGELAPAADSDDAERLWTVLLAGVISQQLANQPRTSYAGGRYTRLTPEVVDLFLHHYRPGRP